MLNHPTLTSHAARLRVVALFLGANDAALASTNPTAHVPLADYEANTRLMIDTIHLYHPEAKIALITPPPVYCPRWGAHRKDQHQAQDRDVNETNHYRHCILNLAAEAHIPVIDLWKVFFGGDGSYVDAIAVRLDAWRVVGTGT